MELADIVRLELKEDDVVEICICEENSPVDKIGGITPISLVYFGELVLKPKPCEPELDKNPPYVVIYRNRERHGMQHEPEQWALQEIKWISKQGHTAYKQLHYHS